MLTKSQLALPTPALSALLRERCIPLQADENAPQLARDVAMLFELDHEVRNGGFAQYFFNHSCFNSFDAWFASMEIDDIAHELLSGALIRIGTEYGLDLDLTEMVVAEREVAPAYGQLLGVYKQTHEAPGELLAKFATFRDRLAGPRDEVLGFDALNAQFFAESDLSTNIAEYIAANPGELLS